MALAIANTITFGLLTLIWSAKGINLLFKVVFLGLTICNVVALVQ